jgi:hypothetical protein
MLLAETNILSTFAKLDDLMVFGCLDAHRMCITILRACFGSSIAFSQIHGGIASESAEHELHRGGIDPGLAGRGPYFVVLAEATTAG